jgi:hypothetical protein
MKNIEVLRKYSLEEIDDEVIKVSGKKFSEFLDSKSASSGLDEFQESKHLQVARCMKKLDYETDHRTDLYLIQDQQVKEDAGCVVAILETSDITDNGDGSSLIQKENFERYRSCQEERFRNRPTGCILGFW